MPHRHLGHDGDEIVPELLRYLQSSSDQSDGQELRRCAAEAVEQLTNDPEVLMTLAQSCLSDRFYKCRLIGLNLVEKLGERGRELLSLVQSLVKDEVMEIKMEARRVRAKLS